MMPRMSTDKGVAQQWLDEAVEAFHTALDAHTDTDAEIAHGRAGHWVNDNVYAIVRALLATGWKPPPGQDTEG
jgi:hypothetical protein